METVLGSAKRGGKRPTTLIPTARDLAGGKARLNPREPGTLPPSFQQDAVVSIPWACSNNTNTAADAGVTSLAAMHCAIQAVQCAQRLLRLLESAENGDGTEIPQSGGNDGTGRASELRARASAAADELRELRKAAGMYSSQLKRIAARLDGQEGAQVSGVLVEEEARVSAAHHKTIVRIARAETKLVGLHALLFTATLVEVLKPRLVAIHRHTSALSRKQHALCKSRARCDQWHVRIRLEHEMLQARTKGRAASLKCTVGAFTKHCADACTERLRMLQSDLLPTCGSKELAVREAEVFRVLQAAMGVAAETARVPAAELTLCVQQWFKHARALVGALVDTLHTNTADALEAALV